MEGLRIAPIGQGAYKNAPRRKPTLTEENVENVWSLDLDEIIESTKENIRTHGPNTIKSRNISWANKPINTTLPAPMTPKKGIPTNTLSSPPRLIRTKRVRNIFRSNLSNANGSNAKRAKPSSQRRMRRRKNKTRRSN
jgi:hypothetical protein